MKNQNRDFLFVAYETIIDENGNIKVTGMLNFPALKVYDGNPLNAENLIWCQATGLRDKNGRMIFEGDIIGSKDLDTVPPRVVIWENGAFRLDDSDVQNANQILVEYTAKRMYVIGNKFLNSDLIIKNEK